jgi:hypothetical protein
MEMESNGRLAPDDEVRAYPERVDLARCSVSLSLFAHRWAVQGGFSPVLACRSARLRKKAGLLSEF